MGVTMTRQRATFGKLQRERDKQAKAAAKRDRRQAESLEPAEEETRPVPGASSEGSATALLELIAETHRRFENGEISFESFEEQKAELLSRLPIE
jgi:hypothetical protein